MKGIPSIIIRATAQAVILRVLPERWMVAQRGMTKPATGSETPFAIALLRVTGMVAAEDDVPRAVKYAGSIPARSLKGLRLVTIPATQYCRISTMILIRKISTTIVINALSTGAILPEAVISRKRPKM